MSVKEYNTLEEWANRYKSEVCGAIDCNNAALDFVILELSRGHFLFNPCESHAEQVAELKDPAVYQ